MLTPHDNPTRDELPRSLFKYRFVPLRDSNPTELKILANQPQRLVPLPDGVSDAKRRQLSGLAQYRGRSPEGNAKSLGNLPRVTKMDTNLGGANPPQIPEGMPKPNVPTAFPQVPGLKTLTGKWARRVLSKEEHDLFVETWVKWFSAHPEWDKPEDEDDVQTICMETVIMFRLQAAQANQPSLNISDPYNQSFKRKQRARENLTARRVDRVGTKANGGNTTMNIAVLAGQITPEQQAERQRRLKQDERDQLDFLEGTIVQARTVIDVPAKEKECNSSPTNTGPSSAT